MGKLLVNGCGWNLYKYVQQAEILKFFSFVMKE